MKWNIGARSIAVLVATLLFGSTATVASGQGSGELDAGLLYATRAQLESMLSKASEVSDMSGYSDAIRDIADDEADLIRQRLEQGDFEVGDQITITVSGAMMTGNNNQTSLSNKYDVQPGKLLILPGIPEMNLRGLLRSELQTALTDHLATYYKDPKVFVTASIRLQVDGEVGQPGFHVLAADQRLPDMLAGVGQPTRNANMDKIRIKRKNETIWDGEELQLAIIEGRTLDQLSLRAGDVIEIPGRSRANVLQTIRSVFFLIPATAFAIWRLSRIF